MKPARSQRFDAETLDQLPVSGSRQGKQFEGHAATQRSLPCLEHDPHAAEPLQLLPVEQDGGGQVIQTGNDRGAGGGETGQGFEDGISDRQMRLFRQNQW